MSEFHLSEIQRLVKRWVRLAIHKAGGNRAAADWTNIDAGDLSRFASDDVARHISFAQAIELDEPAGDVMLMSWARRRGYDLVSTEQKAELKQNITKLVGRLAHASADLQSTALDATADGVSTNNEIRKTETCAGALIGAAEDTVAAVTRLRAT